MKIMTTNTKPCAKRLLLPVSFVKTFFILSIICFFFTFFTVTCEQEKLVEAKGIDLVVGKAEGTGISPQGISSLFDENAPLSEYYDTSDLERHPNAYAIIALSMAVVGLILFFFPLPKKSLWGLSCAILGIAALVMLYFQWQRPLSREELQPAIAIEWHWAYWLCLFSFCAAGVCSLFVKSKKCTHFDIENEAADGDFK